MADVRLLSPKIFSWEGGFVNNIHDKGGATNMGVTLQTWRAVGYDKDGDGDIDIDDMRLLTHEDATLVLKENYWDRWKADLIVNQSVAELLVDWVWGSGKWGIVIPQRILHVVDDGIVGSRTIAALNMRDQAEIHARIIEARISFVNSIVLHDPSQEIFQKGWIRRIKSYKFTS